MHADRGTQSTGRKRPMTLAGLIDPERVCTRRCCGHVTSTVFYDVSHTACAVSVAQNFLRLFKQAAGNVLLEGGVLNRITPSFSENAHGFYRVCGIEAINYSTIVVLWKKACLG